MSNTLAPSAPVTDRDEKGRHFMRIVGTAFNAAGLSQEEAQRVNETPGLSELIAGFIANNRRTNQFANEEVHSTWVYPKEYRGPKPIAKQIKIIAAAFDLDPASALAYAKSLQALPEGAEGWFAIPSVAAIAVKFFSDIVDPAERRCRAIDLLLGKIGGSRTFHNYRDGQITTDRLRQHPRTTQALETLAREQEGDILIIAAQFGLRHRGRSVRRAREVFVGNEFGLGAFEVGCMIFVHPERFVCWEQLHTDCPGDEFSPDADGEFARAPSFRWFGGGLRFGVDWSSSTDEDFGSASAFLPQQK